jgi:hypothetical protein
MVDGGLADVGFSRKGVQTLKDPNHTVSSSFSVPSSTRTFDFGSLKRDTSKHSSNP